MIELPVGTFPVDFLTLVMSHFRNLAGKPDRRNQGFQAPSMKSSVDEVREKEIAFLQGNFDNVRFSENYCFAVHKGDDRYLSLNSTSFDLLHSIGEAHEGEKSKTLFPER